MNRELAISAEEEIAEINRKHQSICDAPRRLLATAIEIGQWFITQREKIEHGEWLPWLRENFPDINARTIQRYVLLAQNKEILEAKFSNTTHVSFLEWPSIRTALREIEARRKDAYDDPIEVEAATPDEANDVEFPFDKAAPEKSAPIASSADSEPGHDGGKPIANHARVPGEGLTLSSRIDDLCGAASTNGGTIRIEFAATGRSRRIATDDRIITGSSKLSDLCAKWLKEHGDNKIDRELLTTPIQSWVVTIEPSTDKEAWIFSVRRWWTGAPEWIRKTLKTTNRYRRHATI